MHDLERKVEYDYGPEFELEPVLAPLPVGPRLRTSTSMPKGQTESWM
jgi:hypothetical protein